MDYEPDSTSASDPRRPGYLPPWVSEDTWSSMQQLASRAAEQRERGKPWKPKVKHALMSVVFWSVSWAVLAEKKDAEKKNRKMEIDGLEKKSRRRVAF